MRLSAAAGANRPPPDAPPPELRSFLFGLVLLVFLSITVLSLRPGGIRRQLRFAARRLRLALLLGGIYFVANLVMRVIFREGVVVDWGPPGLAVVLAIAFLIFGQDPAPADGEPATRP